MYKRMEQAPAIKRRRGKERGIEQKYSMPLPPLIEQLIQQPEDDEF